MHKGNMFNGLRPAVLRWDVLMYILLTYTLGRGAHSKWVFRM